jgi:hypothetical protein
MACSIRAFGFFACAIVLLGAHADSLLADDCDATETCWRRCRPAVSCCAPDPCNPPGCGCRPAPCRCGLLRRFFGHCCPAPACQPPCPSVISGYAPPCSSCAGPTTPALAPGISPSAPVYPGPAVLPPAPAAPTGASLRVPSPYSAYPQQTPAAAGRQSTYEPPQTLPPISVPSPGARDPPIPVRLDHLASFAKPQ